MFDILSGRWSLLWLLGPLVVFLLPLPLVNRPWLFGPWLLGAALLTPLFVYLAARRDPVFRDGSSPGESDE
jgi:hypothetical protein